MSQKQIAVADMQCWVFRMAQTKWNLSPEKCAMLFQKYDLLGYISECYDLLHVSSYTCALEDLEAILRSRDGVIMQKEEDGLPFSSVQVTQSDAFIFTRVDEPAVTAARKEATAILVMRGMLLSYAKEKQIPFEQALLEFSRSSTYEDLFDLETEIWKEGPDYLRELYEEELESPNSRPRPAQL